MVGDGVAAHRGDAAVLGRRDLHVHVEVARERRGREVLDAILDPLHRRADFGRGEHHAHLVALHEDLLAEAAADLRKALELWARLSQPDIETQVERARALALLAGLGADAKSGVTEAEAATFADRAVASLRDAFSHGWGWLDKLKEPDFDALRGRGDFKKLVAEREDNSRPTAKPED